MVEFASLPQGGAYQRIAAYVAIVVLGGALGGYAIHEHSAAQKLAAQNAQANASLNATQHELSDLTAKVNMLASRAEAQQSAAPNATTQQPAVVANGRRRPAAAHRPKVDSRYKKLQSREEMRAELHRIRPLEVEAVQARGAVLAAFEESE